MKRIKIVSLIIAFLLLVSSAACFWRSFNFEEGLETLSEQYVKAIFVSYPRGCIYDRNGIALTNRCIEGYEFFDVSCSDNTVASAVIGETGYLENENGEETFKGVSGVQEEYDAVLYGGLPVTVNAYVDALGNVIEEEGYYVSNDHPNEGGVVKLTLDYNLQKTCEEIMRAYAQEHGYEKMSAVITDVSNGEILCMASCGGYMNNAVMSYQPGSVMKIFTAAVAYDMGIIDKDTKYSCTGTVEVDGEERHCHANEIHGEITVAEAFAHSCNCCFYELAKKLIYTDADGIARSYALDKAKEWGFGEFGEAPKERFILEYDEHYSFVCSDIYNSMDVFNAALGQGKIQASAYTVNSVTCAIAANGQCIKPYLVNEVCDAAGNCITTETKRMLPLGLKPETISWLKEAMCLTGSIGTASGNTLHDRGGLAGKTGTAENTDDSEAHSWFTGFFPGNAPRYAITVVIENGGSGVNAVTLADMLACETLEIYK